MKSRRKVSPTSRRGWKKKFSLRLWWRVEVSVSGCEPRRSRHRFQARDPLFYRRVGTEKIGQAPAGQRIDDKHMSGGACRRVIDLQRDLLRRHLEFAQR